MPKLINTKDWLTNRLWTFENTFVADRDWFAKVYHRETGAQVSLRMVSDLTRQKHPVFMVIKTDDLELIDHLWLAEEVNDLRMRIFGDIAPVIPVILCKTTLSPAGKEVFGWFNGIDTELLDAEGLAHKFRAIDKAIVAPGGASKPAFEGLRDDFQAFSRAHLRRNLSCQDFDALHRVNGKWQVIELKRSWESVDEWLPRLKDRMALLSLQDAAVVLGMHQPTVVNYRPEEGLVAAHVVQADNGDSLPGTRRVCNVVSLFDAQPITDVWTSGYVSTR